MDIAQRAMVSFHPIIDARRADICNTDSFPAA